MTTTDLSFEYYFENFLGIFRTYDFPGKGKGKVHPCTGTEALYRPYGPQEE